MSKTIYKYGLSFGQPTTLDLTGPIVHVAVVQEEVRLWAEAGVHPPRARTFSVHGTGHDIPSAMQHVASAIDSERGFIWHVYEPKS